MRNRALYLGLLAAASGAFLLRRLGRRWGATDEEVHRPMPGDELIPHPMVETTHAITIQAPAREVWPWLVQMGQGRAGFYSYEWIESLMGLNISNADRILPEFQDLKVGDVVPLSPDGIGVPVAVLEPNRALVLGGRFDAQTKGPLALEDKDAHYETSWAFFLQPIASDSTRLIERFRMDWGPETFGNALYFHGFLEPGSFIMERKMLLGIKERVEAHGAR